MELGKLLHKYNFINKCFAPGFMSATVPKTDKAPELEVLAHRFMSATVPKTDAAAEPEVLVL